MLQAVPDPLAQPDLPARLRLGTRDLHAAAEATALMSRLLGGTIDRPSYCLLLRNLHPLYAALEPALSRRDAAASPAWAGVGRPRWHRTAALVADLLPLHGADWQTALPLAAAAAGYAQRIERLAAEGSPALIAHAYVRYLGDLHGGQVLKRRVALALGLAGESGLSFYEFGPAAGLPALRAEFRAALGGLALDAAQEAAVVDEARWGFEQHIRLFDELAAWLPEPAAAGR